MQQQQPPPQPPSLSPADFDAIYFGETTQLAELIQRNPEIVRAAAPPPSERPTLLMAAALLGRVEHVEVLLKAGADRGQRNVKGFAPYHYARDAAADPQTGKLPPHYKPIIRMLCGG